MKRLVSTGRYLREHSPPVRRSTSHLLNGPPSSSVQPASPLPSTAFRYFLTTTRRPMGICEVARPRLNLGIKAVPEEHAYLIERSGEYTKTLGAGFHLLNLFRDRIAYVQYLWEKRVPIYTNRPIVTKDQIEVFFGGVMYIKVVDPYLASYCAGMPTHRFILDLVQIALGREVGKMTYDEACDSMNTLRKYLLETLNGAEFPGRGLECTLLSLNCIVDREFLDSMNKQRKAMGEEGASGPIDLVKKHLRKILEEKEEEQSDGLKA